jgi:chromosome partitioning protein
MKARSRKDPNTSSGKIVLVCKLKGGAGATTSVRELAAAAVANGLKVGVIDLDGQGGLTRWWNRRTKTSEDHRGRPELLEMPAEQIGARADALRDAYDLVLIDSPPSVHATISGVASAVDLAIIPSRPNVDDLDAVGPIFRLLHGIVDIGFLLTQVPGKRSLDGAEALERLAARGPVLGRTTFRAAYSRPPGAGSTGFESDDTAAEEIGGIYTLIRERLGLPENPIRGSGDKVTDGRGEAASRAARNAITSGPEPVMPRGGDDPRRSSGDNPRRRGAS